MSRSLATMPADVGRRLDDERARCADDRGRDFRTTETLVASLVAARRRFGITRVGSLTRLDRSAIDVVQVVRPLSLSNAVSQGKGETLAEAAASALMETIESWAAERIEPERVTFAAASDLGAPLRDLYAGCRVHGFDAGWDRLRLGWIDGYDLFTGRVMPVPTAMVDTVYSLPSPHPVAFPRSTRGLAAGPTMMSATIHAALEVLERAGIAQSERYPRSYPQTRIDPARLVGPRARRVLERLESAGLVAGIWHVTCDHALPVVRCHVMERQDRLEIAPLPGEGFACDVTYDRAVSRALMEAAQARVTALAGAREDITRLAYPAAYDRAALDAALDALSYPVWAVPLPEEMSDAPSASAELDAILSALKQAGGQAALIVPLYSGTNPDLEVVRLVVPPLKDLIRE